MFQGFSVSNNETKTTVTTEIGWSLNTLNHTCQTQIKSGPYIHLGSQYILANLLFVTSHNVWFGRPNCKWEAYMRHAIIQSKIFDFSPWHKSSTLYVWPLMWFSFSSFSKLLGIPKQVMLKPFDFISTVILTCNRFMCFAFLSI